MKGPTPRRLHKYVAKCLGLKSYLRYPGDGRSQGRIPASALLWALLMGVLLRRVAFAGVEALVGSRARRVLAVSQSFGDDALGYFTERLDAEVTRRALATALHHAKRNKAFDPCRFIGLALDGTGAGRSGEKLCELCRPFQHRTRGLVGYHHQLVMVSVVGTGLTLPLDVEPYGPGESEYTAGQGLLRRVIGNLGPRFADYVVVDGGFATAPFLHQVGDLGLHVVARLKDNLPELLAAAQKRFRHQPPQQVFSHAQDRVEIWEADDFDPWEALRWETVRVIRYRQYRPDGTVCEAYWLTDFPRQRVSTRALFGMAKSRGKSRTKVSTTPRTAMVSNISATMSGRAFWPSGFSPAWASRWNGSTGCVTCIGVPTPCAPLSICCCFCNSAWGFRCVRLPTQVENAACAVLGVLLLSAPADPPVDRGPVDSQRKTDSENRPQTALASRQPVGCDLSRDPEVHLPQIPKPLRDGERR